MLKILLTKKVIISALVVLVVGGVVYSKIRAANQPPEYETALVQKGNLVQTVEATGKITSVNDIALRFEIPGKLTAVNVREGQEVKKGKVLANLRLTELNASVAQAVANLNQKLAGITPQDRSYYEAAVSAAEIAYNDAQVGTNQAYQNVITAIQATVPKLDDALTQADNILAIDNQFANEDFRYSLSSLDPLKLGVARGQYSLAKKSIQDFKTVANALSIGSDKPVVEYVAGQAVNTLESAGLLLQAVSDVLRVTAPQGTLTQAELDAKKTTIETTRAAINTQSANVVGKRQSIANAFSTEAAKKAALEQAQAQLESKIANPRDVDVASYRAAVAQAVAARDKAVLVAPNDGVVSKIGKKAGETVSSADVIVQLVSPRNEIEVDISETDVPKIQVGDETAITLDAFGDETKFNGVVTAIEPGATEIQDVVYYKVTIELADSDQPIKPGMTANISILTDSRAEAIFVPQRAVKSREDGTKFVRILSAEGVESEKTVKLGLKANDSKIEITSGNLTEGEKVIISIKEKK